MRRRVLPLLAATAFAVAACTTASGVDDGVDLDTTFAAQLASSWHYVNAPQRVQVGILGNDSEGLHTVSGGTVDLAFAYLGPDGGSDPEPGPSATAEYVPVPGTPPGGAEPSIASGALGVYEAEEVVFDRAGFWELTVSAAIEGVAQQLSASFSVAERSAIPAPGDRAPRTETLTLDSKGVPVTAIDSLAVTGEGVPDPQLHEWSIADAIEAGRPVLALFGTPAFCESRFCGPEVQELERLAGEYPDRAVYIHVEIWRDHEQQIINEGAADWLLRMVEGTPQMTEPWLYLIGADGRIVDRWGSLFDRDDVAAALQALPPMSA